MMARLIGKLKEKNDLLKNDLKLNGADFIYSDRSEEFLNLQFHIKCDDTQYINLLEKYSSVCEFLYKGTEITHPTYFDMLNNDSAITNIVN